MYPEGQERVVAGDVQGREPIRRAEASRLGFQRTGNDCAPTLVQGLNQT